MSDANWKEEIVKERLGGKTEWTDAERIELSRQLDKEMEDRFDQLIQGKNVSNTGGVAAKPKDGWTEENWQEKMAEHPIFAPYVQTKDESGNVVPPDNHLTEGLAQLKFSSDHNTPEELAQNYKEEGNHHFKYKKYRLAAASFTEGLRVKCNDSDLMAQLLNNRAAAYYHLGNFRSAIRDCEQAVFLKPDYLKAIKRGAESADRLGQWEELAKWADRGLKLNRKDAFFVELRKAAVQEKIKSEFITRKKHSQANRKLLDLKQLLSEIEKHGVHLEPRKAPAVAVAGEKGTGTTSLEEEEEELDEEMTLIERELASLPDLEPVHPTAVGSKVHVNKAGDLVWPVLLLYPEHMMSDFIQHFSEKHTFLDQLEVVFGDGSPPAPWDSQRQYTLSRLAIFYENRATNSLIRVNLTDTLRDTLADDRYVVRQGTPSFIIAVQGSKFLNHFLTKYNH